MKPFVCENCGQLLFFPNVRCERCRHRLGYLPDENRLVPLDEAGDAVTVLGAPDAEFRFCANAEHEACNWLVAVESGNIFCTACRHNGTIPDLDSGANLLLWRKLELAKHHLFYSLLRLRLPLVSRREDARGGLVFEFLADPQDEAGPKVMTGHDDGRIVIALAEADDAERERRRNAMGEPYRTLLGHFRHEIGHWYWDWLVRDGGKLDSCRAVFGDDSQNYAEALQRHYARGAPDGWQSHYVSQYATTHPWEDFAETWAHYLHIVDTLEMAAAFRLQVEVGGAGNEDLPCRVEFDPYAAGGMARMIDAWLPLTISLNAVNRCMGLGDLYPFILGPPVIAKLGFIHDLVHGAA